MIELVGNLGAGENSENSHNYTYMNSTTLTVFNKYLKEEVISLSTNYTSMQVKILIDSDKNLLN